MESALKQTASEPATVSFAQAIMKADMGFGVDWLEEYVKTATDLNVSYSQRSTYPIQDIVSGRYDSNFVTTAICRGARVDLPDSNGNTLLHTMVRCPFLGTRKEYAYFPEQNLLSVLALPSNEHQEVVVAEGQNQMPEKELRSPKRVILSFMLCLKRPEASLLKPVQFCILSHLIDSSCSPKLFAITLPQMQDPLEAIKKFPFAWFAFIAQHNTGDDQQKFLKKFAPQLAHYRLERAQEIAARKNNNQKNVYELSCQSLVFMKEQKYEAPLVQAAQEMCDALQPEGFVERHMPKCTQILENMLLGQEPFCGFPEWRSSKTVVATDALLLNNT